MVLYCQDAVKQCLIKTEQRLSLQNCMLASRGYLACY